MTEPLPRHEVAGWVRSRRLPPATKLVLLLAFDHAGPQEDGRWVAWAGNGTLADEAGFAEGPNGARTVRRHLADMEEAGLIEREERTRANGSQTTNYIVFLIPEDWPVRGGRTSESGAPGSASPPQKPQGEASSGSATAEKKNVPAKDPRDSLPDDFPEDLKPHARHVFRVLRAVAVQHGCKAVRPLSLGRLMMGQPNKPFVATAHELHVWSADPPRPIKDVVGTYATFLKRSHDLAGTERLTDEGLPAGAAPRPDNVHQLRRPGARTTAADYQALKGTMG